MTLVVDPVETKPVEVKTPLKLSEAMRLGAMGTKQIFGNVGDGISTTCAIGAVYTGFGIFDDHIAINYLKDEIDRVYAGCPSCGMKFRLLNTIVHMNDRHHMPRNKIADWLESLGL